MEGTYLKKAKEWFDRAVRLESEGKSPTMIDKCMNNAIALEAEGISNGESWENANITMKPELVS